VAHATAAASLVTEVRVTERDFQISAPQQVSNGDLLLTVANQGPENHELIVVRAASARLPLRSDGLTVNEAALQPVKLPSLEPGAPGSVRELRLHLPPGRYVFFCNMAGHFMGGMHAVLVVR
jgi:uncharacterized cupredoxin-like copper-binding protein